MKNRRIPSFLCLTGLVCSFGNRVTSAWVGFKEEKSGRISLFFVCFALLCSNINRRHRLDGVQLWISSLVISTQTAFEAFAKKSRLRVCSFFLCFFKTVTARARTHARKRWQMRPGRPALPCRPVCQKFAHAHAPARLRTKTVGDVLLCALNCILEKTDRSSKRLLSAFKDFDFYSNDRPKHKNSDAAKILSPILTS